MAGGIGQAVEETDAVRHPARKARRDAERGSGWYSWLARAGLVAKGVSFGIVGVLAAQVAIGEGGETTSREGALATIADETLGKVLLTALAAGFAAYAIWRLVQAFAERDDGDGDAKGKAANWGKRAGYLGRGIIYASLTATTIGLLNGVRGGESQNEQAQHTTATVFDLPAGRWLVAIGGLAVLGAGLWNAYRGLSTKFEDKWRTGRMSRTERTWGKRVGLVGHVARGVVFSLIGIFLLRAALDHDPRDAIGLDGALQKLAETTHGPYLLGLTALGLVAYGLFCLVDARYRDVSVSDGDA